MVPLNESALIDYANDLNIQANIRDYTTNYIINLAITTMNSIKLQSGSLIQMTGATNQLTRTAATVAIEKCYQLAVALDSLAKSSSFDDVQIGSKQIRQCASNVQTVRQNRAWRSDRIQAIL